MTMTTVEYRLPVTTVRFSGTVTTTVDRLAKPSDDEVVERTGVARVGVRADARAPKELTLPAHAFDDLGVSFTFLDDGRLVA